MKLLIDQNLPPRLRSALADLFPGSQHIHDLGMAKVPDSDVWEYARDNGFAIVSKDSDFQQLSFLYGAPPKVVSIRRGNCSVPEVIELVRESADILKAFDRDDEASLLIIW